MALLASVSALFVVGQVDSRRRAVLPPGSPDTAAGHSDPARTCARTRKPARPTGPTAQVETGRADPAAVRREHAEGAAAVDGVDRRSARRALQQRHSGRGDEGLDRHGQPSDADRRLQHHPEEPLAPFQSLRQRADVLHAPPDLVGHRAARRSPAGLRGLARLHSHADRFRVAALEREQAWACGSWWRASSWRRRNSRTPSCSTRRRSRSTPRGPARRLRRAAFVARHDRAGARPLWRRRSPSRAIPPIATDAPSAAASADVAADKSAGLARRHRCGGVGDHSRDARRDRRHDDRRAGADRRGRPRRPVDPHAPARSTPATDVAATPAAPAAAAASRSRPRPSPCRAARAAPAAPAPTPGRRDRASPSGPRSIRRTEPAAAGAAAHPRRRAGRS